MFTTYRLFSMPCARSFATRQVIFTSIIGLTLLTSITGCGQKGSLYLVDADSQSADFRGTRTSSAVLESTSQPQDAAFASVDDDDYQRRRYLEQQQVLPEPSDDPNDY